MFAVYSPLAAASLEDTIKTSQANDSAKWRLSRDFVNALVYLHDELGIMHRDLSSRNLCVSSFTDPTGILIDFDTATTNTSSKSYGIGTLPFMAPEVNPIEPSRDSRPSPPPYTNAADMWSLGLNLWALYTGVRWSWKPYSDLKAEDQVNRQRYMKFRREVLKQLGIAATASFNATMIDWVDNLVAWEPADRSTASATLREIERAAVLVKGQRALIEPKKISALKRAADEPISAEEVDPDEEEEEKEEEDS